MKLPKMGKNDRKLLNVLLFLARLILLSLPMYVVLLLNVDMYWLQVMVSDHAHAIIGLLGIFAEKDGLILVIGQSSPFPIYIGPDCTGWKSMMAFFALVFATLGASMKKRLAGLVVGIPLIYLGNLTRITVVVLIERMLDRELALFFHDFLWQAGLISLVMILWLGWLNWENLQKHIIAIKER